MTQQEKYLKVKEVFLYVAKLPQAEREKYLEEACHGDIDLKEEVEALLLAETEKNSFELKLTKEIIFQAFLETQSITPDILINNRYQIDSELARGGFSVVYLAKDLQLNSRPVVIKMLLGNVDSSSKDWQETKFFSEIKALSKINHPNVVTIFDYGVLDNKPFFVMELILGENLRQLIDKSRTGLDRERVLHIVKQIANALDAVHKLGIYHRDLKPENIVVRSLSQEQEHVEVIDFGIATLKESSSYSSVISTVAGTLTYMSPEQLEGKTSMSSDIYALGLITYELLTGRQAFNLSGYKNLTESIKKLKELQREVSIAKASQLNPILPPMLDQVLFKAISYEPQNRYKKASEFVNALNVVLTSVVTDVTKPETYWDTLCSMAQTTDNIWFINDRMRKKVKSEGVGILYENTTNTHSLNSQLSMVLDLHKEGYLLLLVKEVEKDPVCLSPSRYVANDELRNYPVLLPTEGLINKTLPFSSTKGRKHIVAIISQVRIDLAWPKATLAMPAHPLALSDIYTLINKLEKMPLHSWTAFYSCLDII